MKTDKPKWIRVKRGKPCPICGKPDWCSVSEDGMLVYCMRVESSRECKSGGWFHRIGESVQYKPPTKKRETQPVRDFAKAAGDYVENLTGSSLETLAHWLGVSVRSLVRLDIGWNGQGYTFPMRDGRERIIGIRVRGSRGKWCVKGSHNGLFWPEGVYSGSDYPLILCEGESDCAALLTMGFDAIGRPGCLGSVEHIVEFLRGRRRDVIIMADKDSPKKRPDGSVWYPGQEGAVRLLRAVRPLVRSVKIVKPPFHKDVRAWLNAGATKQTVEAVIQNMRYVA